MKIRVKYSDYVNDFGRMAKTSNYDEETKTVDITVEEKLKGRTEMLIRGLEGVDKYIELCKEVAGAEVSKEEAQAQLEGIKDMLNKVYNWNLVVGKKYIV